MNYTQQHCPVCVVVCKFLCFSGPEVWQPFSMSFPYMYVSIFFLPNSIIIICDLSHHSPPFVRLYYIPSEILPIYATPSFDFPLHLESIVTYIKYCFFYWTSFCVWRISVQSQEFHIHIIFAPCKSSHLCHLSSENAAIERWYCTVKTLKLGYLFLLNTWLGQPFTGSAHYCMSWSPSCREVILPVCVFREVPFCNHASTPNNLLLILAFQQIPLWPSLII